VAHAEGVVSGMVKNNIRTCVISGPGLKETMQDMDCTVEEQDHSNLIAWHLGLVASIRRLLKRNGSPRYVIVRYAVSNFFIFTLLAACFRKAKWGFEVNSLACHQYGFLPSIVERALLKIEAQFLKQMDFIYVVSNALKNDIGRDDQALLNKIIVAPNAGPDPIEIEARSKPLSSGRVQFCYMGIFQPYYDFNLTIDAFKQFCDSGHDAELHFFGSGPTFNLAVQRAAKHDRIFFHGRYIFQELISEGRFGKRCIMLLPYSGTGKAEIHSPIKLFEYMAMGYPIISSDAGQAAEILVDGYTAVFYQKDSVTSLKNAMVRVYSSSTLRDALLNNIRREYGSRHTWSARMGKLINEINRLVE